MICDRCAYPERPSDKADKGFTLVEVMVAMMVLVIGILGVLHLQAGTIRANSGSMAISLGVQDISAGMEALGAYDKTTGDAWSEGVAKDGWQLFVDPQEPHEDAADSPNHLTYDVEDLNADDLRKLLNFQDHFPGARGKRIVMKAQRLASGKTRNIRLEFIKIDR